MKIENPYSGESDYDPSFGRLPVALGRYQLIRLLGRGGMGKVFLAHDTQLDRKVAIKVPKFDEQSELAEEAIERFYREARSMATLKSRRWARIP